MAQAAPLLVQEKLSLTSIGVAQDFISFKNVTMESDKYICIRETGAQNTVVIVDMANPLSPARRQISADSALMCLDKKVIALKAVTAGTAGDTGCFAHHHVLRKQNRFLSDRIASRYEGAEAGEVHTFPGDLGIWYRRWGARRSYVIIVLTSVFFQSNAPYDTLRPHEPAPQLPMGSVNADDSDSSSDSSIDEAETAAVEMLLEAYFMQVDHTYNRLQTVHEYIKDTEDLVTIKLDQHRNQLITIDLLLTSFTTTLNLMTVVGGYFGMNLNSDLQEAPNLFNAVVLTTTLGSLVAFVVFLLFLHRQRLLYY